MPALPPSTPSLFNRLISAFATAAFLGIGGVAVADTVQAGFESAEGYTNNTSIHNQGPAGNPWKKSQPAEPFNEGVSSLDAHTGTQSLRWSNTYVNLGLVSFLSPTTLLPAGETGSVVSATGAGGSLATPAGYSLFINDFWFRSVATATDPGLNLNLSLTDPAGARMTYLRFSEASGALQVNYQAYDLDIHDFTNSLVQTNLAWGTWYHVRLEVNLLDGASNDVVKVYLGTSTTLTGSDLKLTDTTWEDYYRDTALAVPGINSMLTRITNDAGSGNTPQGLLMDDVQLTSAVPEPATAALASLGLVALLGRRRQGQPLAR